MSASRNAWNRAMRTAWFAMSLVVACQHLPAQDDATAAARRTSIQTAIYPVMMKAMEAGDYAQARTLCEHAITMEPRDPVHRYNLACIEARAGVLPRALAALEQAVQLGFNDRNSLQNDPDLAAIRNDPKFAAIVAKVSGAPATPAAAPASTPAAASTRPTPPSLPGFEPAPAKPEPRTAQTTTAKPAPAKAAPRAAPADMGTNVEKPAPAGYKDGVPVGLFFMTRYWMGSGLEKAAWYFAPDHSVYERLETGFSTADLAAHGGRKGNAQLVGDSLEITWTDGKKTKSKLERDGPRLGFAFDGGLFNPVQPIPSAAEIAGSYEGGESVTFSGSHASVAKGLELRADGTFRWSGTAAFNSRTDASRVTTGGSNETTGTWRAESYSLILADNTGKVIRGIAFPYDDDKTPIKPDRLFFLGTMYKKQP